MTKKFQRKKEDFKCEHCGNDVIGDGYTNHCPMCLWSKHVDIFPGDREELCCGMMRPIAVDFKKGKFFIIQKCEKCNFERRNKVNNSDDLEAVAKLSEDMFLRC